MGRNLPYTSLPERLDKAREFQQIRGAEPASAGSQRGERVFRREIGPANWNLALATLLVDKAHPVLTAIFFLRESFKLSAVERVKGMGYAKSLSF